MVNEILNRVSYDGNILRLPDIKLERNDYLAIAKQLELIGGKWKGGKTQGFVFDRDPHPLVESLLRGNKPDKPRNIKKEVQFFPTPPELADHLVELSGLRYDGGLNHSDRKTILEPSAGHGAIIHAIHRANPKLRVDYCEILDSNRLILADIPNTNHVGDDFLELKSVAYDYIIANPPFAKNQDIDHVMKMWELLAPGGVLVSVMSKHWLTSSNKKESAFREFVETIHFDLCELPGGAFKKSGTMVASVIVKLQK